MTRLPDGFFDGIYADSADPWGFEDRWYEQRKRALTTAILPRPEFRNAFEPGCSIGVLTELLAPRCTRLLATDVAQKALESAQTRIERSGATGVSFARWALGDPWPDDTFDLIVLSEVGYYLTPDALPRVVDDAVAHLDGDGVLLVAHWRHPVAAYPLRGGDVHAVVGRHAGLVRTARYDDEDVLLETFAPAGGDTRSVARREGLVE